VLRRVNRAAGIVRVDENNGSGGAVSQGAHAGKVGLPAAPRQEVVEPRLGAGDIAGCLVRREARPRQKNVRPRSATEHCGDGSDGARATRRHEHVGLAGAVARAGGQVVGDCLVFVG
jgi:hypothetical protein